MGARGPFGLRDRPPVLAGEANLRDDGYRGIWFTLGQMQEYGDKYSGGLATYTANHVPMAIYSKAANKTFFVYGGAKQGKRYLLHMIAYYDHARGVVPRPTIVHDKQATVRVESKFRSMHTRNSMAEGNIQGASVRPAKGTALVAKNARRPTIFPPPRLSAQRANRSHAAATCPAERGRRPQQQQRGKECQRVFHETIRE
jgi:hypothetical protein